jgi:4-amino-4-deoxy-L-arabinose transferase-like glycosyltransferase
MRLRHIVLLTIFIVYGLLGGLFALRTPAWQAPDEPAHYNYVRFVATTGGFPVLQPGDYPHAYLEEIKSRKFPTDLSIAPIRYEFHQPPLYYALLTPLYGLTQAALLPLRLASVLLGAGVVALAYAIGRRVLPDRPAVALGATAFVAFLPQHLATVAQVGNDVLAELLLAATLYLLSGWVIGSEGRRQRAEG